MWIKGRFYPAAVFIALFVAYVCAGTAEEPAVTTEPEECETDQKKTAFHDCFDDLKNDMMQEPPDDVNEFLCGEQHKNKLDCVIKKLNECPSYVEAPDVKVFKHLKSGLTVNDLLYVSSSDEFCKCAPTYGCLQKIDTEKLGEDHPGSPWKKLANSEYICGIGRNHIDCVANSLPQCVRYLQYKYNKTMEASMAEFYDVRGLEYAAIFAEFHCKNWPTDTNNTCVLHRSTWYSTEICYEYAEHYKEEQHMKCGMRTCIQKAMVSCPKGSMDYFIDSANVFGENKIARTDEPCPASSAAIVVATLMSLLLALFVSTFL